MEGFVSFWNGLMSLMVLGGIAVSLSFIFTLLVPETGFSKFVSKNISRHILVFGLLVSLSALVSSLIYSEAIGYPPCLFCWWARVFFYPQVVLYGLAVFKKDRKILDYSLVLTIIGTIVSGFHYTVETIGTSPIACEAGGVSCLNRFVYEYGFITIPLMGLIGFVTLLLAILVAKREEKQRV